MPSPAIEGLKARQGVQEKWRAFGLVAAAVALGATGGVQLVDEPGAQGTLPPASQMSAMQNPDLLT